MIEINAYLSESASAQPVIRCFQKREFLPMIETLFWRVHSGMVRNVTLGEDGSFITLGIWNTGDIVGQPLSTIRPYQIECLSDTEVHRVQANVDFSVETWVWANLHQSQVFFVMIIGPVELRVKRLVLWMARKFGTASEDVTSIPHCLTHQDIAETIGSTRVTVTRTIGQLERAGMISWSRKECLLHHNQLHHQRPAVWRLPPP